MSAPLFHTASLLLPASVTGIPSNTAAAIGIGVGVSVGVVLLVISVLVVVLIIATRQSKMCAFSSPI